MKLSLEALQPLGRALMLPIAVLPIAGLLLRLGQPDLFDLPFVAAAGAAVFDNLGLLFAAGIGAGLAKDGNGAAALAGLVCFLIATRGAATLLPVPVDVLAGLAGDTANLAGEAYRAKAIAKLSVPVGILAGLIAGAAYNRYSDIRLPDYLSFFGGRRFVPIISGLGGLILAALVGFGYAPIAAGIDGLSRLVIHSGMVGLFLYGVLNRLLIITGLHHILNNVVWFIVGDFHGSTGDLKRFFAGDPTAGSFMAGFFPVMMFGLPAACLAMYRAALPERRKAVGGLLFSMAATAFLTGVTEPIEFTFIFLAPVLYALHMVLTGVAFVIMDLLGVKLGFTFSAGALDYVLNYSKATRPWLLLPVGLAYFAIYYGMFSFAIRRLNLKTPGRDATVSDEKTVQPGSDRGAAFVAALGGSANLTSIDACTTRLRLVVADQAKVDEPRLLALGARGLLRPSLNGLQVVLGPIADQVATEMRVAAGPLGAPAAALPSVDQANGGIVDSVDAGPWLAAIGGRGNLAEAGAASSRIWLKLRDAALVDRGALANLGVRATAVPIDGTIHLIVGSRAGAIAQSLQ
ncbi:N-acetylglucosamine-specific PTS transporter subunit IIBC [Sphingomonas sp. ASY06-1R]|uniref:N-acetylglucosamine-specific PTS transporter subunit IIBC n=1 Tax=Sphingomonas sp. ASY06-1R TaxID=3445771 RepID=UPI003FA3137B